MHKKGHTYLLRGEYNALFSDDHHGTVAKKMANSGTVTFFEVVKN